MARKRCQREKETGRPRDVPGRVQQREAPFWERRLPSTINANAPAKIISVPSEKRKNPRRTSCVSVCMCLCVYLWTKQSLDDSGARVLYIVGSQVVAILTRKKQERRSSLARTSIAIRITSIVTCVRSRLPTCHRCIYNIPNRSVAKSSSGTSLRGDVQPRLIKVIYDPPVDDRWYRPYRENSNSSRVQTPRASIVYRIYMCQEWRAGWTLGTYKCKLKRKVGNLKWRNLSDTFTWFWVISIATKG